ncbi:NAD(P)H-binding protein [Microbacterium oryzae]|uniref:NAD(P)-dependent oxidoreductase n=1 Tax=Microbacterium oryzae TaxID=743009 RepID=UPI0025B0FA77|nr:NAD(P)H-binding protein [Microbacterium oryzae]MDN3310791.1 NAD(P)H-binding protein [Microbacterium oryzae]
MTRIVVFGGTGFAGSHIVRIAAERGHSAVSYSRSEPAEPVAGVEYRTGSLLDADTRAEAFAGADVVVSAVAPRGEMAGRVAPALAEAAEEARAAGVRLGVIGGAGSLFVSEDGPRLLDAGFPEEFKPEALEMTEVLEALRGRSDELDWFFVSPAAGFGAFNPGEETGSYRLGGDVLLVDEDGESFISGADLALAIVEEIENPRHQRARFTAAY